MVKVDTVEQQVSPSRGAYLAITLNDALTSYLDLHEIQRLKSSIKYARGKTWRAVATLSSADGSRGWIET